jgi:TorA maturation chaperone TorD
MISKSLELIHRSLGNTGMYVPESLDPLEDHICYSLLSALHIAWVIY